MTQDESGASVAAAYAIACLSFAESRGIGRRTLLDGAGLSPALLASPENRVPMERYVALLRAGALIGGDPAFALHFGEAVRSPDISILGVLGASLTSLKEGEQQLNRYAPLMIDDPRLAGAPLLQVVREGGRLLFTATSLLYAEHPLFTESAFARCVVDMRMMLRGRPMSEGTSIPLLVQFSYPEPVYRAEYDRVFGVPLEFGAARNAFIVDELFLTLNVQGGNLAAKPVLTAHAEEMLARLESGRTFRGRVERALLEALPKNDARIVPIASALGVSRQTLFRRLQEEGVTFEQVLRELRQRLACQYLGDTGSSVQRVASLLGFSDATAFARAFRRWTGQTPGEFRSDAARSLR